MKFTREQALKIRAIIEKAVASLDDIDALEAPTLFPQWQVGKEYNIGDRVCYNQVLYKVLTAHTSQADWAPDVAVSLFAKVLIPDENVIPDWEQPESTNPYSAGDVVKHKDQIWVSDLDNNVWEPGVYGWSVKE